MRADWVIIGGGIHGVHLAARLIGEAGVPRENLRILDEQVHLLDRWKNCTATTGMSHLRSPAVHHLDLNPWSLVHYAGKKKGRKRGMFAPPYDRPSLELFNSHCQQVVKRFGLNDLHIQGRAERLSVDCDEVRIEVKDGSELIAGNVVLAMGNSETPEWPEWAPTDDPRVRHIFEPEEDVWPQTPETVVVVGGGISAGQVALRLLGDGHQVQLVSRHAFREHQFDSDPGWLGPKYMAAFEREPDVARRRQIISEARHKGSVPPDVLSGLKRAMRKEEMVWHQAAVERVETTGALLAIQLSTGETLTPHRLLMATGFTTQRPGGRLVDDLVSSHEFPCSSCGYPIVDEALRWHPRVFVAGPLAELELGPASRNISGARRAGDRLVKALNPNAAGLFS